MSDTWRVFCAIDLPTDVKEKLATRIEQLKKLTGVKAGWTRPENIHLTIKFLGNIPVLDVKQLSQAASSAVKSLAPFKLTAERCGVFPTHGPPRVLWIGITDSSEQLAHLSERLDEECAAVGLPKEARPFHPHLTLARIRSTANARALAVAHREIHFPRMEFAVNELLVIRSELGTDGSKYTTVSRHVLHQTPLIN
jgi:RNA 2',3'-cyclic 3'-phosphodiesterase